MAGMAGRVGLAVVVLAALAATPARAAAPPPVEVVSAEQLSPRLTEYLVRTPALDFDAELRVLLPDGYQLNVLRRYPVLYLMHGSIDDARSWTTKGATEALTAGRDLIVVMPAGAGEGNGGGWASDWRNGGAGGSPMWETFTIKQLIPWIDSQYRTLPWRNGRAIAGYSMGGFAALSLAARHPDVFVSAASWSGAVDTNYPPTWPIVQGEALADGGDSPDAIWGPRTSDEVYWRAHNPWDLAANLAGMQLALRTGNGQPGPHDPPGRPADGLEYGVHEMSASVHNRLEELGIPHVWDDYGAGTHSWAYWNQDLEADLPRFLAAFAFPPPPPLRVTYTSADPEFAVWGWRVAIKRDAVEQFATLVDAGRWGFVLRGSGTATVVTPPIYRARSRHRIVIKGDTLSVRAGRGGRLRFSVPLGPERVTIR
jgi:S-formylglutathione hydrolase FrmB